MTHFENHLEKVGSVPFFNIEITVFTTFLVKYATLRDLFAGRISQDMYLLLARFICKRIVWHNHLYMLVIIENIISSAGNHSL